MSRDARTSRESSGERAGEPDVVVRIDTGGRSPASSDRSNLVALLERAVRSAFACAPGGRPTPSRESSVRGAAAAPSDAGEISLALLDDADIRRLNREHLGRDRVTDVIAFPLWQEGEAVVGDVYVGVEQARRQAEEEGIPVAEELVRLAVHGTLHVLGWDHPEEASEREASPMYRRQERIVRSVVGTTET